jgi:hypothetical protein
VLHASSGDQAIEPIRDPARVRLMLEKPPGFHAA